MARFQSSSTRKEGGGIALAERPEKPAAGARGQVAAPTQEAVARRAYEIWIKKGRPQGQERQNWLEAEAQLKAEWQAR